MSCSDKVTKWNSLGVQGGLLEDVVGRVWISSISIEVKEFQSEECLKALRRGLLVRERGGQAFKANEPLIIPL